MSAASEGEMTLDTTVTLNDGNEIPILGFGTFQIDDGPECEQAVLHALEVGYRHIDTAHVYGNEASVGRAISGSDVPRDELFVTTKTPFDLSPSNIRQVLGQSLEKLQTDYVDLYLIHWPMTDELAVPWETLVELRQEGKCRSIGVSNFTVRRFEEAFQPDISTLPAVNQVECHVFNQRPDIVEFCREKGIEIEAYSPLTRGQRMSHPVVTEIAASHGKAAPQVMIRWLLQKGIVTIPKSSNPDHIRQNADIFDFALSEEQMRRLDELDEGLEVQDWHPKGFY